MGESVTDPDLRASLASPPPSPLAVGRGITLLLAGSCHHRRRGIARLDVGLDGSWQPVAASTRGGRAARSGRDLWWALVDVPPVGEPRTAGLALRARLAGSGAAAEAALGEIELRPGVPIEPFEAPAGARNGDGPLVAICMATWNPPAELFRAQVESIRAQDHGSWVCVIADDASEPGARAAMRDAIAGDERFLLREFTERRGFYGNFERTLALAPADAELIALCDQDDAWRPDKLTRLRDALAESGSKLAYSDMRVVTDAGEVVSPTFWNRRPTNHTDLEKLLLANTITGAASLFRRELLDVALPFPPRVGDLFHDHWIAAAALATGDVAYVPEPLHDYVQHDAAAQGHARANFGATRSRRWPLRALTGVPAALLGGKAPSFFLTVYLPALVMARTLQMRAGDRMTREDEDVVRRFAAGGAGLVASLAASSSRPGLRRSATFGRERVFLAALAWERLARLRGAAGIGTPAQHAAPLLGAGGPAPWRPGR